MTAGGQLSLLGAQRPGFLLLSIRSDHADRIIAGSKRYELRKALPKANFSHVFLHVTGGAGLVAAFEVRRVIHDTVDAIWRLAGEHATTRDRFDAYFRGWSRGYAIEIESAVRFPRPLLAREVRENIGTFTAPQGFLYVWPDTPLYAMLEGLLPYPRQTPESVTLRTISADERSSFTAAVNAAIQPNYEGIGDDFARALLDVHDLGHDPEGFLTLGKQVLSVTATDGRGTLGFTTLTAKIGGSVKTGPTVLFERYRRRGVGRRLRRAIEDRVLATGGRKVYCTAPDTALAAVGYLLRSGYRVEAHLKAHYSNDHGELVFGKVLRSCESPVTPRPTIELGSLPSRVECSDTRMTREMLRAASRLLRLHWFRDAALAKVVAARAIERVNAQRKPRRIVRLVSGGRCTAMAVLATKRGGATKALVAVGTSHTPSLLRLIDAVEAEAGRNDQRKVYFLHPMCERRLIDALITKGYSVEGVLREPYEERADVVVLSRFLRDPPSD